MAYNSETTFAHLESDERFKKLERSLKLAMLRRKQDNKSAHNGEASSIQTWPSISSINVDASYTASSLQDLFVNGEILASSNNLQNILLRKRSRNVDREAMVTSSVKCYNAKQNNYADRDIMPPPAIDKVYRSCKQPQMKTRTLSECKISESTSHSPIQSISTENFSSNNASNCITVDTNNKYLRSFVTPVTPANDSQKISKVFTRWRVMLNDQQHLIIKGTLECGRVARSKPLMRRHTAKCVESIYRHKYSLEGNIVDEKNELPDYIRGKFFNGFPDDWENVYQIWRTFVNQGCPIVFRWPTPITDSDDDLKSELTDFTYVNVAKRGKTDTAKNYSESIKSTGQLIELEDKPSENLCLTCSRSLQSDDTNSFSTKLFRDPVTTREVTMTAIAHTTKKDNEPNIATNSCSSRRTDKLKDIFQEDKLNIIISNLEDKNCPLEYVDKIIEMFDCWNYISSYKVGSKRDSNSIVDESYVSKSEVIPLQQISVFNKDNATNTSKLEKQTESKNYAYFGRENVKNDPNSLQTSSARSGVKPRPQCDRTEDDSESEVYAGVPKISIEQVLLAQRMSGKTFKHKVKRKEIQPNAQKYTASPRRNVNARHELCKAYATPIADSNKDWHIEESCVSITEEENIERVGVKRRLGTSVNSIQRPPENILCNGPRSGGSSVNSVDIYRGNACVTRIQNTEASDVLQAQRAKLNAFIKEQTVFHRGAHVQVTDVDYTSNSDVERDAVVIASTRRTNATVEQSFDTLETQRSSTLIKERNVSHSLQGHLRKEFLDVERDVAIAQKKMQIAGETSRANDQDVVSAKKSESTCNNEPDNKPCASLELCDKFNKTTTIKGPSIISSIPVNVNIKVRNRNPRKHDSDESGDKQHANVGPMSGESHKKKCIPLNAKTADDFKTTVDNMKESGAISNTAYKKRELDATEPANLTNPTQQAKSNELEMANPKVLTAWTPNVVYNSESKVKLGLTFQGKLLNEVGHVVHRKFTTEIVLKRLSETLIETMNRQVYQLLGCLNNKHVVPKELVKQCRNGCPTKIEQFCLTWKSLQHDKIEKIREKTHDASIDMLSVPISSRGRKILPPLCFWAGERVTLKDNTPVYSPGTSQESLTSLNESPNKTSADTKERKGQRTDSKNTLKKNNTNKRNMLPETFDINKNQTIIIEKDKSVNKSLKANAIKSDKKRSRTIIRQRVAQQLTFSSSEEEEEEASPRKRTRNQSNGNAVAEVPSQYTMRLRNRQNTEISSNKVSRGITTKCDTVYRLPTKRPRNNIEYTYYQSIPMPEDSLSEDEISLT